jgi:hypothetical protein
MQFYYHYLLLYITYNKRIIRNIKTNEKQIKNTKEIKKMTYFKNIQTIEELKKAYRVLAMKFHPDRPTGDLGIMKIVNNEYDFLLKNLKETANVKYNEYEYAENFKNIIDKLIKCNGLIMEICGSWLWVTGNTKENKTILMENGFKWRSKKVAWSLGDKSKVHHAELSMDKIRNLYGSKIVKSPEKPILE